MQSSRAPWASSSAAPSCNVDTGHAAAPRAKRSSAKGTRWRRTAWRAAGLIAAATLFPALAHAAPGPGLGNLDCGDDEYFKPFAFIQNPQGPNGTNVAVMVRGYFMTIFAPDSGHPPGEIGLYDVSNPKSPVEVKHIENSDTDVFREAHSMPVALIDGKHYMALQTISGMQFWDFTDPLAAKRIGHIDLPGVNGGDYENVAWQSVWQGRYLYVAGANRGIYVVDAGDPTAPKLVKEVPTSSTGGFRVGPLFALGDYLVISNMDQGGAYAVLDISEPEDPALLAQLRDLPRIYAIVVGGNDRIYAAGRDGDFLTHSFADPTKIELVKNAPIGQDQLYAAAQDEFVFLGRQNNVVKVDMSDEQNPVVVGEGTLGRPNPDHGQVTPMGNLIFIGNDHGTGSAFFCHQRGQDTRPPEVQSIYPKSDSTGVSPKARVSIVFSDYIDLETVDTQNVSIRPAGGEPLDGIYTYAFNTLSFEPNEPFEVDATYEVVLPAGGVSDVMGNALAEEVLFRFSTGESIVVPPPEQPEPATGGAPGGGMATGGTPSTTPPPSGGQATGGAPSVGADVPSTGSSGGGCAWGGVAGGGAGAAWGLGLLCAGFARRRSARRA